MTPATDPARPGDRKPTGFVVIVVIALCVATETTLLLGDLGLFGIPRFRPLVYEYAGFWPGLLHDWRPNYPLQPWTMFLSYGFLHTGIIHLALNMVTLHVLARPVLTRVGEAKFALLYAVSILGGGLGTALLSDSFRPIVGASGALFGLAGAILAWEYADRFAYRQRLWPVARAVLLLALLNVALYFAMSRLLAWEAHLGGFVTGWATAFLIGPRSRG